MGSSSKRRKVRSDTRRSKYLEAEIPCLEDADKRRKALQQIYENQRSLDVII